MRCRTDGLFSSAAVRGLQRMLESVGPTLFAVVGGSQGQDDIITLRQMCVCVSVCKQQQLYVFYYAVKRKIRNIFLIAAAKI